MGSPRGLLLGVCAVLITVAAIVNAENEAASSWPSAPTAQRKNMNYDAAFKGLQVAIKCKNGNGEYESKAVGELDNSGTFSISVAADLHGADCFAQLRSSGNTPCPGQEPSKIAPLAEEDVTNTFVAVAGKTHYPSAECASATICDPIKSHFHHFHKKPVPPKPEPKPQTAPEYHPPTPTCGPPTTPTPMIQSTTLRPSTEPDRPLRSTKLSDVTISIR